MSILNRLLVYSNNAGTHNGALVKRQTNNDKNQDTYKSYVSFLLVSTVVVQ